MKILFEQHLFVFGFISVLLREFSSVITKFPLEIKEETKEVDFLLFPQNMSGRKRNLPSSSSSSGPNKKLECCRVYKRRTKNENVDIISNLPEHILHHIFTFVDMKQAIKTCLLSRRWRYFWASLPTLNFRYNESRRNTIRNGFVDFVDRVLMFRSNSNIDGFVLATDYSIDITDRLNTWILASVFRNAREITLATHFPKKFHIHQCLLTCKSLTKLVVKAHDNRVIVSLPHSITLPRLKTLSLHWVKFEDEYSTNQLFSSCPVLESLSITYCDFPHINVNISSPILQHLVLSNCRRSNALDLGPVGIKFQLCAPKLISLRWCSNMSKCCAPENLSSLVRVVMIVYREFTFSKEKKAMCAPFMVNLLRGLRDVEDLRLSASFLEFVTGAPYLLDSQPTKFCNLRCLKLTGTWRSLDCIHAISYLLKISPNIETLFVKVCDMVDDGAPDLLEVQPTQFYNLRCLKMNTLLSRDCIYTIAYLLKICPKIETLSFKVSCSTCIMHPYWNPDEITSNSAKNGDYWKAGLSLEGLLNLVKCFELSAVTGRVNELEFIEILLKNAMLLEKLVIVFKKPYRYDDEKELTKFSEKVLTFPRVSSTVLIMFEHVK